MSTSEVVVRRLVVQVCIHSLLGRGGLSQGSRLQSRVGVSKQNAGGHVWQEGWRGSQPGAETPGARRQTYVTRDVAGFVQWFNVDEILSHAEKKRNLYFSLVFWIETLSWMMIDEYLLFFWFCLLTFVWRLFVYTQMLRLTPVISLFIVACSCSIWPTKIFCWSVENIFLETCGIDEKWPFKAESCLCFCSLFVKLTRCAFQSVERSLFTVRQ